jgi:hypothetical protein
MLGPIGQARTIATRRSRGRRATARCWSKSENAMTLRHDGLLLIYWIAHAQGTFAIKYLFFGPGSVKFDRKKDF